MRSSGFNEAAGIHRRKLAVRFAVRTPGSRASMRPPEFTGGNIFPMPSCWREKKAGFNEAAGIHRRKRAKRKGRR